MTTFHPTHTSRLAMLLVSLAIVSCDTFSDDQISPKDQLTFGKTFFYTVPGSPVLIDASMLVKESFVNATMTVSRDPSRGSLSQVDNVLLEYQPQNSFISGTDDFVVSITLESRARHNETVTIIMKSDVDELPCGLHAIRDKVTAVKGYPLIIPVTENDVLCGIDPSQLEVSVHSAPANGTASVNGKVITYTPGATFSGEDELIYKLSAEPGDSVSYAPIKIHQCWVTATPDTIDITNGEPSVNILLNDELCGTRKQGLEVSISWGPLYGTASLIGDSVIVYSPGPDFAGHDQVTYQLASNGENDIAYATVQIFSEWKIESFAAPLGTDLFFVDKMTGFITGIGGGIYKTTNGGETWTFILATSGWVSDIHFVNTQVGYASYYVCQGFLDPDTFICNKWVGGVLKTSNGGETWQFLDLGLEATSIYFRSATEGYVSVLIDRDLPTQQVKVYKTEDGGEHWREVFAPPADGVPGFVQYEITFAHNKGYLWGTQEVFTSDNTGESWEKVESPGEYMTALAVTQTSAFSNVASDFNSSTPSTIARKSHDGNWQQVMNFKFNSWKMDFSPSGNLGITAGMSKLVYDEFEPEYGEITITRTVDQGESWVMQTTEGLSYPTAVSVPTDEVAYILCYDRILRYSNR